MSRHLRVILVFARAPVPGRTKTRLIPALGEEGAAALQQHLLQRTLDLVAEVEDCAIELWCAPETTHPVFHRLEKQYRCRLQQQVGNDLGERMAYAMQQALNNYPAAVIIGTDCPELSLKDLEQSFRALEGNDDAVIGPAADGGYYLLGLGRFERSLFQGVRWGSDCVFGETLQRFRTTGLHYSRLTTRHDLDRPEDLQHFPEYRHLSVKTESESSGPVSEACQA